MGKEVEGALRTQPGCPAPPSPLCCLWLVFRRPHPSESDIFSGGVKLRSIGFPEPILQIRKLSLERKRGLAPLH